MIARLVAAIEAAWSRLVHRTRSGDQVTVQFAAGDLHEVREALNAAKADASTATHPLVVAAHEALGHVTEAMAPAASVRVSIDELKLHAMHEEHAKAKDQAGSAQAPAESASSTPAAPAPASTPEEPAAAPETTEPPPAA